MGNPGLTLHMESAGRSFVLPTIKMSNTAESSVSASEPSPPSHCKASILHNERIDPPLFGDGGAVMEEEAGRIVAVPAECAITGKTRIPALLSCE